VFVCGPCGLMEGKFLGAKVTRSESLQELSLRGAEGPAISLLGAKVPENDRARERLGQGAKGPGSKLAMVLLADSLLGANWPGSEKAVIDDDNNNNTHAPVALKWTLSVNMLCRAGKTQAGYSVMLRSTT